MKIVNIGVGAWYPKGSKRLRSILLEQGLKENDFIIESFARLDGQHTRYRGYEAKLEFIERMLNGGDDILWLDCSVVPMQNIKEIIAYIQSHDMWQHLGCWAYKTGYTIRQSVNDQAFNKSKLQLKDLDLPEFATTVFALKNGSFIHKEFIRLYHEGAHIGSRDYDAKESKREGYLFHRQDQSCMTLAINAASRNAIAIADNLGDVVNYNYTGVDVDKSKLFLIAGGYGKELPEIHL